MRWWAGYGRLARSTVAVKEMAARQAGKHGAGGARGRWLLGNRASEVEAARPIASLGPGQTISQEVGRGRRGHAMPSQSKAKTHTHTYIHNIILYRKLIHET